MVLDCGVRAGPAREERAQIGVARDSFAVEREREHGVGLCESAAHQVGAEPEVTDIKGYTIRYVPPRLGCASLRPALQKTSHIVTPLDDESSTDTPGVSHPFLSKHPT